MGRRRKKENYHLYLFFFPILDYKLLSAELPSGLCTVLSAVGLTLSLGLWALLG